MVDNNDAFAGFWGNSSDDSKPVETPKEEYKESIAARQTVVNEIFSTESSGDELVLDDLLRAMINAGSSDLHLSAKLPPMLRINGDMTKLEGYSALTGSQINTLMNTIMTERHIVSYEKTHELDFAYAISGLSRFRVNVLKQRGQTGSVIRAIPNVIKSTEELGLPEDLNKLAYLPRGLVLVTGPTGSGKSTTLAAIIDRANRMRHDHIITIEDPVEFVHEHQNCVITQREIGVDTESFPNALKAALREDPDIILVGEMRDLETISTAITAAETGHLVFGTLHTQSAAETISRIVDVFPDSSKDQVRQQLGATIQGIVCQTLVKTTDGKRAAAIEFMKGIPSIRNLIRKNKIADIRNYIETGSKDGMRTLDQDLERLVKANRVKVDVAAEKAVDIEEFYKKFGSADDLALRRRREDEAGSIHNRFAG
jgi:twitching motility protein PilT